MSSVLETSLISRDRPNCYEFQDKGRKARKKNIYIHICVCLCIECSLLCILGPSITEVIYKCVYSFSIYFIFYEKFSGFRTLPDGITAIVLLQRLWEINEVRTESHEKIEFFLKCSVSKNTTATIPGRAISLVANLKAHQWPQHSFWVIAILNGALISLAWPGL